jgi:hypothetical protein
VRCGCLVSLGMRGTTRIATSFNDVFKMAASLLPRSRLMKHVMKQRPGLEEVRFTATGLEFFVEELVEFMSSGQGRQLDFTHLGRVVLRVLESDSAFAEWPNRLNANR